MEGLRMTSDPSQVFVRRDTILARSTGSADDHVSRRLQRSEWLRDLRGRPPAPFLQVGLLRPLS
jgi:hypothetical protein